MHPAQLSALEIIECMTDGFVAFDQQWRYTYVNVHAARVFGTTPGALLGREYLSCFPEAEGTRFHQAYQRAMREKVAVDIEEYFPPWDRWFENHVYPLSDGIAIFFHEITSRKRAEAQLAENVVQLAEAQRLAQLGSWNWDLVTGRLSCSEELYRIFGRDPSLTIDSLSTLLDNVVTEDQERLTSVRDAAVRERQTWTTEYRIHHPQGFQCFIREQGTTLLDSGGEVRALFGYAQDISSIRQAEHALLKQQKTMAMIVDALPINIYLKDEDGNYLMFNAEAARVAGIAQSEAIGKNDFDLFPEPVARQICNDDRFVRDTGQAAIVETTIPVHGQPRHMLAGRSRLQLDGEQAMLLGFAIDITERRESELRSQYLGTHDVLTGLPNRGLLSDRLNHAISHAHRSAGMLAVLFLDLDRFKIINDSLGHRAGDELLCAIADRLRSVVREGDTLARMGGDEFVVVLEDLRNEAQAAFIAEAILSELGQDLVLHSQLVTPAASMGISIYPKDGADSATLLKHADTAMYQAKAAGSNCLQFFDLAMNANAVRRLLIESNLRRALAHHGSPADGGVDLHYQPIVDLSSGALIGMEALARWNFVDKSISSPDHFIPVAEETGLIIPLGEKLLRQACRQFQEWQAVLEDTVTLSVNLSVRQLGAPGLVAMIQGAIDESGMDPSRLQMEITETGLMQNVEHAQLTLHGLAQMGIRLSIDDFGTGYSSLSYLKTLPIHKLKIDRSFVHDVVVDSDDASIVMAIINLAHNMGLKVISEGVETREQMAFLKQNGCDEGQGYYFSQPLDSLKMNVLLHQIGNGCFFMGAP